MKTGPVKYFVDNPVAAKLLMMFLIIGGVIAGFQLPVRQLPEIDLRSVVVTVASPDSSPREIEEDINRRLEEKLVGIDGVARVVSEATQGFAKVEAELETFADADTVLADIENAVDSIQNFPPASAELPSIGLKKMHYEVLTLAVSSSVLDEDGLRTVAEDVFNELMTLPWVSKIRLRGARDREIAIEIDEEDLRRNNLTISEVASKVRRTSLNVSFGELNTDAGDVVLHVVSKKRYGRDFEDIPLITRRDGTIVRLGQVANIRDGFVDERLLSEIDGKPAVFLRVEVAEGQSFTKTANSVKGWLADYEPPASVEVSIWNDNAAPISDRFSEITGNAIIGIVLVFLCLVLVFDLRVAIWVTVGIPLVFVASFMFFGISGLTLNMGTLMAFFILIGIVVDDALVVGESIAAERDRGKGAREAVISGARAVAGPITVGVITTVLAFLPFLYVTAENYQIVQVFFWVALFVLAISLVEAFCILPAHLSHEKRWSLYPLRSVQEKICARIDIARDHVVVPIASWAVRNMLLTFSIGILFVASAIWLVRSDTVPVIVFDNAASVDNTVKADLVLPEGTSFDATAAAARRFVDAAEPINGQLDGTSIESVGLRVGELSDVRASRTGKDETIRASHATVTLKLHERPVRQASPEAIERIWRQNVGSMSDLEEVSIQTTRARFKPSVAYTLVHDDSEFLHGAAAELKSYMGTVPGLYALADSLSPGKRQFEIELTPVGKAAGLTPAMISKQLRANFHGLEVQRIQRGRNEISVMVRYPSERRRSLRELTSERITVPGGQEIPLSSAVNITETRELGTLTRVDGRQAARVNAHADLAEITPMQARRRISEDFFPGLLEKYPGLVISPDAGARDERTMLATLAVMVPFVLLVMYGLMASFLRSYWKPLVVVFGVPMAFAGAVFGHWILGWHLTAVSLFGMIGVSGVIMNDALVLLDRYNTIRRENEALPAIAAAAGATRDRFRAVFLTSLTTLLGLSPLLYERSEELLFLVPFVVSMLGGLFAATVFTLFGLPALVMLVEGRREA
ncbi:MAG: efflux RND transporter permease subunit [Gammaproteobacteria bacterium]|nr:efflux RND transporter permease subunit [Gammaproteobacteria bacterium]